MKHREWTALVLASAILAGGACNALNGIGDFSFDEETLGQGGETGVGVTTGTTGTMSCGADSKDCFGQCVPLDDPNYGCASPTCEACPSSGGSAGPTCSMGICADSTCPFPSADCDTNVPGCETTIDGTDAKNCGGCGEICPGNSTCCPGMDPISVQCADLVGSPNNCGGCGMVCQGSQVWCANSTCTCKPGLTLVNGKCIDQKSDPKNCGMTGNTCSAMQVCEAGACKASCSAGLTNCAGACVDITSNSMYCGNCNTACANNQVCYESACIPFIKAAVYNCSSCPCADCPNPMGSTSCVYYPGTMIPLCLLNP